MSLFIFFLFYCCNKKQPSPRAAGTEQSHCWLMEGGNQGVTMQNSQGQRIFPSKMLLTESNKQGALMDLRVGCSRKGRRESVVHWTMTYVHIYSPCHPWSRVLCAKGLFTFLPTQKVQQNARECWKCSANKSIHSNLPLPLSPSLPFPPFSLLLSLYSLQACGPRRN